MSAGKMRDNVERWLIHEGLSFEDVKNPENSFQIEKQNFRCLHQNQNPFLELTLQLKYLKQFLQSSLLSQETNNFLLFLDHLVVKQNMLLPLQLALKKMVAKTMHYFFVFQGMSFSNCT